MRKVKRKGAMAQMKKRKFKLRFPLRPSAIALNIKQKFH
jgi:hypothetical protein